MQNAEMQMNERLREARIKAGFKSAADFARRIGVPYGTYSGHENGNRGIKNEDASLYAKKLKIPLSWLMFGFENEVLDQGVAYKVGEAGINPDGSLTIFDLAVLDFKIPKMEWLDSDIGAYLEVKGKYLGGFIDNGSVIFCEPDPEPPSDYHMGKLCVCFVKRRAYIKYIFSSSEPGLYDLDAPNALVEKAVPVDFVAPILIVLTPAMVKSIRDTMDGYLAAWKHDERTRPASEPIRFLPY